MTPWDLQVRKPMMPCCFCLSEAELQTLNWLWIREDYGCLESCNKTTEFEKYSKHLQWNFIKNILLSNKTGLLNAWVKIIDYFNNTSEKLKKIIINVTTTRYLSTLFDIYLRIRHIEVSDLLVYLNLQLTEQNTWILGSRK